MIKHFLAILILTVSAGAAELENLKGLLSDLQAVTDSKEQLQSLNGQLDAIRADIDEVKLLSYRVATLEQRPVVSATEDKSNKFTFVLENDEGGYADDSWEEIIAKGQALQETYWKKGETYWTETLGASPSGEGWYGTVDSPVITILCLEPEYWFRNTARVPGRFQVRSPARWQSVLRFYGTGPKNIIDDIAYGTATNAKVGMYVEPATFVGDGMVIRAFEQGLQNLIIVGMNGILPVYLAMNQDRFWMIDCNIQQHQGALIGIKHGPILNADTYPFPATQRKDGNVYLADPRFIGLQMEGPHTNKRPQAAMLLSGNNIIITDLNLYGWMQGPYMHGGQGRLINGLTIHDGITADGRRFCDSAEIVSYTMSTRSGNKPDAVSGIAGGFMEWVFPKRTRVPSKGGWHNAGESTL